MASTGIPYLSAVVLSLCFIGCLSFHKGWRSMNNSVVLPLCISDVIGRVISTFVIVFLRCEGGCIL
jgi:hypothetical protein